MTLLGDCDLQMTVKVNLDHVQNETTLRLGQELPLIKKFHINLCKTFCVSLHTDGMTDKQTCDRMTSAFAQVIIASYSAEHDRPRPACAIAKCERTSDYYQPSPMK